MAISTNTFTINSSYTKQDMITQIESAFTWLGWHDKCDHTGIVTGLVDYGMYQDDDPNDNNYYSYYYSAEQTSTTGVGTGASFYIRRYYGNINWVMANKPGYGYTNGEYLSFVPGEASRPESGIGWGCTVYVNDSVSYGTTHNGFYTKNIHANNSYPYGVLRHKIQDNKKYGVTYRAFQANNTTQIEHQAGPFFHPLDFDPDGNGTNSGGTGSAYHVPRFAGEKHLDTEYGMLDSYGTEYNNPKSSQFQGTDGTHTVASSNNYQLDLNVYRSGIDTNFCVMSYRQPTLSSTKLRDNTFYTWIPHNFTTPIWDLDNVCLAGNTEIYPGTNESQQVNLTLQTNPCGSATNPERQMRAAEAPYDRLNDGIRTTYESNLAIGSPDTYTYAYYPRLYNRDSTYDTNSNTGAGKTSTVDPAADYNAVIKGVPLNAMMVPSPYNMPEDFALIDFVYDAPSVNIQQGDTITISGTEVWTVIQGCYNQTTTTRGILFVGRKV
tara:strand:+ start:28 stop:1506 length:1479 start_codon:yes stop_codon:yes gene_type:complete